MRKVKIHLQPHAFVRPDQRSAAVAKALTMMGAYQMADRLTVTECHDGDTVYSVIHPVNADPYVIGSLPAENVLYTADPVSSNRYDDYLSNPAIAVMLCGKEEAKLRIRYWLRSNIAWLSVPEREDLKNALLGSFQ